jgi:hypothetical protein
MSFLKENKMGFHYKYLLINSTYEKNSTFSEKHKDQCGKNIYSETWLIQNSIYQKTFLNYEEPL